MEQPDSSGTLHFAHDHWQPLTRSTGCRRSQGLRQSAHLPLPEGRLRAPLIVWPEHAADKELANLRWSDQKYSTYPATMCARTICTEPAVQHDEACIPANRSSWRQCRGFWSDTEPPLGPSEVAEAPTDTGPLCSLHRGICAQGTGLH